MVQLSIKLSLNIFSSPPLPIPLSYKLIIQDSSISDDDDDDWGVVGAAC